ncbi:hypothetical protein T4E_10360 [Trichinella pseudospiralis]|uniref:Uncharacterized protein n=1 Tax=Trichinella pseudospiralis TaxID=6337 RepID=A0A0V0Y4Q8_TRIPS|nr:hypothetical protein T4E_10360 [Trichinella pseudospiralis]KRY85902.1 hypothetical protein T4D_12602 [Trichinella pseudospiralis]
MERKMVSFDFHFASCLSFFFKYQGDQRKCGVALCNLKILLCSSCICSAILYYEFAFTLF